MVVDRVGGDEGVGVDVCVGGGGGGGAGDNHGSNAFSSAKWPPMARGHGWSLCRLYRLV